MSYPLSYAFIVPLMCEWLPQSTPSPAIALSLHMKILQPTLPEVCTVPACLLSLTESCTISFLML